jgi:hypothetical protein
MTMETSEFQAQTLLARLASEAFDWYRFDEDLPCARDQEVLQAVQAFSNQTAEQRDLAATLVDVYSAHALVSFAERCASWALTTRDPRLVFLGLVAVGWQWLGCEDPCDGIAVMGALYDASIRLSLVPAQAFADAGAASAPSVSQAYSDFLTRGDLDEIAKTMGYAVRIAPGIAHYCRSW